MNSGFCKCFLTVLFCSALLLTTRAQEYWTDGYSPNVQKKAQKENRHILLFFTGSDWCPACRNFEKNVLQSQEFDACARKELLCVRVDFPRLTAQPPALKEANGALLDKMLGENTRFPAMVLLDPQGKKLGKLPVCTTAGQFILQLNGIKNLPPVFQAARDGDKAKLEKQFTQGADPCAVSPSSRLPLLSYAICENAPDEILELILKAGAFKNIDQMSAVGLTPLCYALENGRTSTVELLLKHKASVQTVPKSGKQPLILAIRSGKFQNVQLLLNAGCPVNTENNYGIENPLHYAIKEGNRDIIRALLERGAQPNIQDKDGNTPLHYAVILRDAGSAWLLMRAKASPNIRNKDGKTPLDLAKDPQLRKILQGK